MSPQGKALVCGLGLAGIASLTVSWFFVIPNWADLLIMVAAGAIGGHLSKYLP